MFMVKLEANRDSPARCQGVHGGRRYAGGIGDAGWKAFAPQGRAGVLITNVLALFPFLP